jgi:tetratricopeptide (TPR) repeat protein
LWIVRESILNTGFLSAAAAEKWQLCLDLSADMEASMEQRGAGPRELARARCNDAGPLLRLGRLPEAVQRLAYCQAIFEDHGDIADLAQVLSTRAILEAELGNTQAATDLTRTALRYSYAQPEHAKIAISHANLALFQSSAGGDRAEQRAHQLAALLIYQLTGMTGHHASEIRSLTTELREDRDAEDLPSTVAEVIVVAEQAEGVRLAELLQGIEPDPSAVEAALAGILRSAAGTPEPTAGN